MKHRLPAKKSLGQHFLVDTSAVARIADAARPAAGSGLVEVGPGTGNLTAALLDRLDGTRRLLAIEPDRRMAAVLAARFGAQAPELVEADAAALDWGALLARPDLGPHPVVVGNLPYYAALPILFAALQLDGPAWPTVRAARIVVMVQQEVAERLVAGPSSSARGQVSVKLQLAADVRIVFRLKPGAFQPPPKVRSAVLVATPLAQPRVPIPDLPRFSRLVTMGFAARRKTLVNALALGGLAPAESNAALADLGLDLRIRAEALDLPQWARLAERLDTVLAVQGDGSRSGSHSLDARRPRP